MEKKDIIRIIIIIIMNEKNGVENIFTQKLLVNFTITKKWKVTFKHEI